MTNVTLQAIIDSFDKIGWILDDWVDYHDDGESEDVADVLTFMEIMRHVRLNSTLEVQNDPN